MQNNYIVYEHKNKNNNKRYIGITSQTAKQRWRRGSSYSKKTKIYIICSKYDQIGDLIPAMQCYNCLVKRPF